MLGVTGVIVTAAQISWMIENHSVKDIVVSIVSGWFLILGAADLWRLDEQRPIHSVEVTPDGIRIRDSQIFYAFLPYSKIKSVQVRDEVTLKDNLRDTFSWGGRSQMKGRHVLLATNRIVMARPLFGTKSFRFKVEDPEALASRANEYRARYRGMPG